MAKIDMSHEQSRSFLSIMPDGLEVGISEVGGIGTIVFFSTAPYAGDEGISRITGENRRLHSQPIKARGDRGAQSLAPLFRDSGLNQPDFGARRNFLLFNLRR